MELKLKINDSFIETLKDKTGINNTIELTKEAFAMLDWAITEVQKGRVIVSENEDGSDETEVVMESLKAAKRHKRIVN